MVKILKFDVPGHCEGHIRQVLNVKLQYGKPVVWVVFDDEIKDVRALDFYSIDTGWELDGDDAKVVQNSAYLGTLKDEEGYIKHYFCLPVAPTEEDKEKKEEKDDALAGSTDVEASTEEALG